MIDYVVFLRSRIMIVFVKKVRKLMMTLFGYIHPIKMLYLLDTLHHIFRCSPHHKLLFDVEIS